MNRISRFCGMWLWFGALGMVSAIVLGAEIDRTKTRGGVAPAGNDLLLLRYGDDPDTLNPINSNDTVSEEFQRHVYEPLAERNNVDPKKWDNVLAESWELDEKTLTYTIHLRKGVYWHPMKLPSGKELPRTEFTSRDVKFTFDAILNEGTEATTARSYFLNPNAKTEAEKYKIKVTIPKNDKYTVQVKWSEPYLLATEFTLNIAIMPRHVYGADANGDPITLDFRNSKEFAKAFNEHWANTAMCGTGPLIFQEWKKEEQAVLVRNPDYWGQPFYFSKVVYKHISNENTALQKLLQNELDSSSIPEKDLYIRTLDNEAVTSKRVELHKYDYPAYRYLGFNLKRELFQDVEVRQAIAHAVPIDEIIDKIYHNLAIRVTGPFLPGGPETDGSLKPIPYDLDKARALLDQAGWKDTNQNGTRDKIVNGKSVEAVFDLMIFADSPQFRRVAEVVQENCRKIGVEVRISQTKWALMLQKLRKKEFDACILGWAMGWQTDPFQIWHGSQAELPESGNHIGYNNPKVNELIEKLRVTIDEKQQQPLYHAIHKILYDQQPYVFLYAEKATGGHHSRLDNFQFYKLRPCVDSREWTAKTARSEGK